MQKRKSENDLILLSLVRHGKHMTTSGQSKKMGNLALDMVRLGCPLDEHVEMSHEQQTGYWR